MSRQRPGQPRPRNLRPAPAPGDLHLLEAFVNTRDLDESREELHSPEMLRAWLARQGLAEDAPVGKLEWQCALAVREGLRALLRAHNGAPTSPKAVDLMNRALSLDRPYPRIEDDGAVRFEPLKTGWPAALARLLGILLDAMRSGNWERLKACRNSRCQWAFFDAAQNRSGKWCTARRCGNRVNSRIYRRRQPPERLVGPDLEDEMLANLDAWLRGEGF